MNQPYKFLLKNFRSDESNQQFFVFVGREEKKIFDDKSRIGRRRDALCLLFSYLGTIPNWPQIVGAPCPSKGAFAWGLFLGNSAVTRERPLNAISDVAWPTGKGGMTAAARPDPPSTDSITPHCVPMSINKAVFTADSGPRCDTSTLYV